jgi:two-component system response regulator LytT
MKKVFLQHIAFWISILIILTIIFGFSWKNHRLALYFSLLLLPVVVTTTYFFNIVLVPKYLLKERYLKFILYFFYLIVVSLYLEMLVSVFSFVVIAETNKDAVDLEGISIFILGITLYLIVFVTSFVKLFIEFKKRDRLVTALKSTKERNEQQSLTIRVDRKNQLIPLDKVLYIESLNDYVKVVTSDVENVTRDKITSLNNTLPDRFIRIHRSFLVNIERVISFTTTEINIDHKILPISRTYKNGALKALEDYFKKTE